MKTTPKDKDLRFRETPQENNRRELDELEKAKGRSSNYWQMSGEEQWAEDRRLGILDWDGT